MRRRVVGKAAAVENRRGEAIAVRNDPFRRGRLGRRGEGVDLVAPVQESAVRRDVDGGAGTTGESAAAISAVVVDRQRQLDLGVGRGGVVVIDDGAGAGVGTE